MSSSQSVEQTLLPSKARKPRGGSAKDQPPERDALQVAPDQTNLDIIEDDDIVIGRIYQQAQDILSIIRDGSSDARPGAKVEPRFPISRVAQLVGRTDSLIRNAEKKGRLPERQRGSNGRRLTYTLTEVNEMRRHFGTMPRRADDEQAVVIAVQNFKGGVGKSTIAIHLAQHLAIQGYRVCLIDCDSQASSTMQFGYVPDLDLDADTETLHGFLVTGDEQYLPVPKKTHFDGLYLIPANLQLYDAEYDLAAQVAQASSSTSHAPFQRIDNAVQAIAGDFDVIILDPPPALGMISLGVMSAASAMIIPTPPTLVDFSSTASFIGMMLSSMKELAKHRSKPVYKFVKLLGSKVSDNKSIHKQLLDVMQSLFGRTMLTAALKDSSEIDNASARMMTVFELERPVTSRDTHNRCMASLNAVCSEIETEIRKTWPSHHDALRQANLL